MIGWPFFSFLNACIITLRGKPGIIAHGVEPGDITKKLEEGSWKREELTATTDTDLTPAALSFISVQKPQMITDPESACWRSEFEKALEHRRIFYQRHGAAPDLYRGNFVNSDLPNAVVCVHCSRERVPTQHAAGVTFVSDMKFEAAPTLDFIERGMREFFDQRYFRQSTAWTRKSGKAGSTFLVASARTGGRDERSIGLSVWFHGGLVDEARKRDLWLPQTFISANRYERNL